MSEEARSEEARRLIVGPFNRVEGDLEVRLDVKEGQVEQAFVSSPLFRGFERILEGRDPRDALVIAPRICGICSVSQSHAAALALAALQGIGPTRDGRIATNLILAAENVADHLTHFHVFFMPDFARATYEDRPWFAEAAKRFKAAQGTSVRRAIQTRSMLLHVLGILGGRWPHTLALQPGGVTRGADRHDLMRLLATLRAVRKAAEDDLFGAPLEEVAALDSLAALEDWRKAGTGDARLFLDIAEDLDLKGLGRAYDRFLSYGAYAAEEGHLYGAGTFAAGTPGVLDPSAITEDHAFSRMEERAEPHHPYEGSTFPDAADEDGYTWCKAPRLSGVPFETGAFARQVVAGHPLARDLAAREGANVRSRVVGRLLETARTLLAMEGWVKEMSPEGPWCAQGHLPQEGRGFGLTEAARGALGHWMVVQKGRIARYQIIAPTTWNFSPRDGAGVPGPLEAALVGAPVRQGEATPVSVQHVVRSFDPCMVCTVH